MAKSWKAVVLQTRSLLLLKLFWLQVFVVFEKANLSWHKSLTMGLVIASKANGSCFKSLRCGRSCFTCTLIRVLLATTKVDYPGWAGSGLQGHPTPALIEKEQTGQANSAQLCCRLPRRKTTTNTLKIHRSEENNPAIYCQQENSRDCSIFGNSLILIFCMMARLSKWKREIVIQFILGLQIFDKCTAMTFCDKM